MNYLHEIKVTAPVDKYITFANISWTSIVYSLHTVQTYIYVPYPSGYTKVLFGTVMDLTPEKKCTINSLITWSKRASVRVVEILQY